MAETPREKRGYSQLIATIIFVSIVAFQVPFFKIVAKGEGQQKHLVRVSPLQVVASQLLQIKKPKLPEEYIKMALWPGAAFTQIKSMSECAIGWRTRHCARKTRWLPNWENLIRGNDPRRVEEAMDYEFKDRKVQLVAASFFCVVGAVVALFSSTRLPIFGCVLYWYPLAMKRLYPSFALILSTICALCILHFRQLRKNKFKHEKRSVGAEVAGEEKLKTKSAAAAKVPSKKTKSADAGTDAETAAAAEYMANLMKNVFAEKAAREAKTSTTKQKDIDQLKESAHMIYIAPRTQGGMFPK
eukprot:CAMPEP_0198232140 /NCGR_PEP_ID=MMETSP1445-20131203/115572_1 /TAXON_ID=36898 /ORGANISM="Pyramimonas sp., Strain CCMP2087" /LENGTH=299 /DNA_ID=CAMNT_0043912791 /DNA_START=59 /DNA_END=959 /DNA_ORIENTATION=+